MKRIGTKYRSALRRVGILMILPITAFTASQVVTPTGQAFASSVYKSNTTNVSCSQSFGAGELYSANVQILWSNKTTNHTVSIDQVQVQQFYRNYAQVKPAKVQLQAYYIDSYGSYIKYRDVNWTQTGNIFSPAFWWPQVFYTATSARPQHVDVQISYPAGGGYYYTLLCGPWYFWS